MTYFSQSSHENSLTPIRQLHRSLAPIMLLPILLTLITGLSDRILDLGGKGDDFDWLLDWHKGHFGFLNLERIHSFLKPSVCCFSQKLELSCSFGSDTVLDPQEVRRE